MQEKGWLPKEDAAAFCIKKSTQKPASKGALPCEAGFCIFLFDAAVLQQPFAAVPSFFEPAAPSLTLLETELSCVLSPPVKAEASQSPAARNRHTTAAIRMGLTLAGWEARRIIAAASASSSSGTSVSAVMVRRRPSISRAVGAFESPTLNLSRDSWRLTLWPARS